MGLLWGLCLRRINPRMDSRAATKNRGYPIISCAFIACPIVGFSLRSFFSYYLKIAFHLSSKLFGSPPLPGSRNLILSAVLSFQKMVLGWYRTRFLVNDFEIQAALAPGFRFSKACVNDKDTFAFLCSLSLLKQAQTP